MNRTLYSPTTVNADAIIFKDVINSFIAESVIPIEVDDLLSLRNASEEIQVLFARGEDSLVYEGALCLQLEKSFRQGTQWKEGTPVYGRQDREWVPLETATGLARFVLKAEESGGVENFLSSLEISTRQLQLSLQHLEQERAVVPETAYEWFLESERIASFRDRPFHPVSKAKIGFTDETYQRYMAEFEHPATLSWVAVRNESVASGEVDGITCLDLLDSQERDKLVEEMESIGINHENYTVLPVHPWQMQEVIAPQFNEEINEKTIIPLSTSAGSFFATSSLRSMAPASMDGNMLKLPVSVTSLGAARYLPVVKLLNSISGERLLRQAIDCDEVLKEKVYVCEENAWWGYLPSSMGLFDDHPRHLSAQIRYYPEELLNEPYQLITMSSLGAGKASAAFIANLFGEDASKEAVTAFYEETASLFYEVVMRFLKLGVVPEIHGQNCCLVLKNRRPIALLFRDHDSVRLHPPYTERHGIQDPEYRIRPGFSNSLYNDSIEDLLFYVQTLGTQVNMAAIMETLAETTAVSEESLWAITKKEWQRALQVIDISEYEQAKLHTILFEHETWPVKLVVRPLLEVEGVPGAMPSGKSEGPNPFQQTE